MLSLASAFSLFASCRTMGRTGINFSNSVFKVYAWCRVLQICLKPSIISFFWFSYDVAFDSNFLLIQLPISDGDFAVLFIRKKYKTLPDGQHRFIATYPDMRTYKLTRSFVLVVQQPHRFIIRLGRSIGVLEFQISGRPIRAGYWFIESRRLRS